MINKHPYYYHFSGTYYYDLLCIINCHRDDADQNLNFRPSNWSRDLCKLCVFVPCGKVGGIIVTIQN